MTADAGDRTSPQPASPPTYMSPYHGQPTNPYQPGFAPAASTNGFAIASLVLGILGVSLLGLIFGIIAMGQTKRSGQRGRGLAIAGVTLSTVWLVAALGLVAAVLIKKPPATDLKV